MFILTTASLIVAILNFIFVGGKWVANSLNRTEHSRETAYLRTNSHTVSQ